MGEQRCTQWRLNEFESGGGAPVRRRSGGTSTDLARSAGNFYVPLSHYGKHFRDGQYSLVSFLFAVLLTVSPCPAICESGGHVPPCPVESEPLAVLIGNVPNR